MNIVLILLGIAVAAWLVAFFAKELADYWRELPHFLWNYVGGVLAIVGATDYKNACAEPDNWLTRESGQPVRCVLVPETLTLSDRPRSSRTISTGVDNCPEPRSAVPKIGFCLQERDTHELFVPFASEQYLTFSKQETIFLPVFDVENFAARKVRENRKIDFRLRFRDYVDSIDDALYTIQTFAVIGGIFLLAALGFVLNARYHARATDETVTIYTTSPSIGLKEITTNVREQHKLLLGNDPATGDNIIIAGKVSDILAIGGNSTQVCVSRNPGERDCGSADSSLHVKAGDTVYIKPYALLQWNDGENIHRTPVNIVITKAEAEQLVSTGQFTIHEK
jgi:hypothetical protein